MSSARPPLVLSTCLLATALIGPAPAAAQDVFGNPQTFFGAIDARHRVLAVGDIDGDGREDVVWLVGNAFRYALGTGTGGFATPVTVPSGLPTLGPHVVSGDINGDGRMDLVVGPGPGQSIAALALGTATGLTVRTLPQLRVTGTWPFLADADNDGDLDLYFVGQGVTLWQNDGFGNFELVDDFDGVVMQERGSIAVGDLDGDGRADLVLPAIDGDHQGLDIAFVGARNVTGLPAITSITVQPSLLEPGILTRLADIDGDGDLDIVLHGRSTVTGGPVLQVLRNEGSRTFSALPPVATLDRTGDLTTDMLIADLDLDGLQDVVLGCAQADCRLLLAHHGAGLGALGPMQVVPVLTPSRRLLALDVDCDGDPDIVGGSLAGVSVVLNRGARQYEDQVYAFIAGTDLAAGHFNADAAPDLVGIDSAGVDVALGRACGIGEIVACTLPEPTARIGDDVVACGQPGELQTIALSGLSSGGGRPIARYCWETTNGHFVESGVAFHCSAAIGSNLRLPTIAGRTEAVVTLTVTDFQGCSDSTSVLVATESEPVIQEARVSSLRACTGDSVSFVARAADIFSPILTYGWDFDIRVDTDGDGNPGNDIDGSVQAVSGGLGVVAHRYLTPGTRTARLIAFGDGACFATADVQIEIVSAPRITAVGGPAFTCPNRPGSFSVNQTGGTQPIIYSWDFDTSVDADGNGNPADDTQSVLRNPTWSYDTPGQKTVRVRVLAGGGCSDTREIDVFVAEPPEADFVAASPVCGTTVVGFQDASVGKPPLTATWDFGDGSPLIAGLTATHVFPGPGSYTVTETVRDGDSCTTQVSRVVTIADVDLSLEATHVRDGQAGTASEGNANGFGEPGETIELRFTATNRGQDTVTGLEARVRVLSPLSGVQVIDGVAEFPPIDGGGTASSFSPGARLRLENTLPCGTSILLDVELIGFDSDSCADSSRVTLTVGLPALTLFSSEAPVTQSDGRSLRPASAFAEDHHVTVYSDDAGGVPQVLFVRHLFDGPRVLPPILLSESGNAATAPRLAWNPAARELGIAWRRLRADGQARIAFARVTKTGQIIGEIRELGAGFTGEPDVAWTGTEWVVAWPEGTLQPWVPKRIRAVMLDPSAQPITPILDVSADPGYHDHVRLSSVGGTWQAAYTTREQRDGGPVRLIVRTFRNGAFGELVPIAERTIVSVRDEAPAAAMLAGRHVLAWTTAAGEVQVATLEPFGAVVRTDSAGTASQPAIVGGPDFAVLTYSVNGEVFARGLSQTGALFSRVAPVSGGVGTSGRSTVSASPQGLFMVFWEDTRRLQETNHEIYGAVLVPVGDPNCRISGLGDIAPAPNGDGIVNVGDVILLLRVVVGLEPVTPSILLRGDVAPGIREGSVHRVVGDGDINVGDVVVLLDVAVGNVQLAPDFSVQP